MTRPATETVPTGRTLHDVSVERRDGVVTVILDRPRTRNAITLGMVRELLAVLEEVEHDPAARAVVLTGAGGAFSSGADLSALPEDGLGAMRTLGAAVVALHRLHTPTIAQVRGPAVGLGASLALACDLVVMADTATLSYLFARRGLSLDGGGSWLLPRLIGLQKAKELAYFGEALSGSEARDWGLCNAVVPEDELEETTREWAERLASGPPIALSLTKSLLNASSSGSIEEAVDRELTSQLVNFGTHDAREGMRAFLQGRAPRFEGR